jgi:hypothetical protein
LVDIQVCSDRIPRYSSSAFVGSVGAMLFACSRSADVFDIGSVDIVGKWGDGECSRWIPILTLIKTRKCVQLRNTPSSMSYDTAYCSE